MKTVILCFMKRLNNNIEADFHKPDFFFEIKPSEIGFFCFFNLIITQFKSVSLHPEKLLINPNSLAI